MQRLLRYEGCYRGIVEACEIRDPLFDDYFSTVLGLAAQSEKLSVVPIDGSLEVETTMEIDLFMGRDEV